MGKMAVGLASAGMAAALLPASAGANATTPGGGLVGGSPALAVSASVALSTTGEAPVGVEAVVEGRLSANHNETVLALA